MQCLCRPRWQPVFLIREIWQTLATQAASYCVRGDRARQATRRRDAGFTGMLQERLTTFTQVGKYLGSWPLLGWGVSPAPSPEGSRHLLVIQSKAGDDFIHSFTKSVSSIWCSDWGSIENKLPLKELREGDLQAHTITQGVDCASPVAQSWPNPSATWVLPKKGTEELQRGGSNGSGP